MLQEDQQFTSLSEQASLLSELLQKIPPLLELPLDHPRPKLSTWHGETYGFSLDAATYEKLLLLCQSLSISLETALLAIFATLLFRYTGQEDSLIGTPCPRPAEERGEAEVETDFVLIPIHCSAYASFREFLEYIGRARHEARSSAMLSLAAFLRDRHATAIDRSRPLCQIFFQFDDLLQPAHTLPGAAGDCIARSQADLACMLTRSADGLTGRFVYNALLFEEATVARMAGHLQMLLQAVTTDCEQPLADLLLLTEAERRQVLEEWNDTSVPYHLDCCIHEHFEAQAKRTPDAPAVVFLDRSLTYRELDQRANQLAHYLQALGVAPDVLVGIYVDRSLEMIVAMLGVLKAGGAYVPLDPTYPRARLAFLLQDAQPRVLLTQEHLGVDLPATPAHVVALDSDWEKIAQEDTGPVTSTVGASNLAYVIYTSGSTGIPKGVEIWHRSLVNYITYARELFDIRPDDHFLQFASISFDASAEDIYPCLTGGATLYIRHDAMLDSIPGFLQYCEQWGITKMQLATAFWHELVLRMEEEALAMPASLRLLIIGGERAIPERVRSWQRMVGQRIRLLNTYGPTEATITSTAQDLTTADLSHPSREVSIGRPVANTRIYLLDARLKPVPVGVAGEIYIGGANVGRGYLRRPELTAQRFVPDPFDNAPHSRLYKTGDLARYLPNGEIEYLGRVDHQVKVRGFRIELGEIEAILGAHPAIGETIVTVREDEPGNQQLVAYIIFLPGQERATSTLKEYLQERLPPYMVPTAFVPLRSLPLLPSGKVDRNALPPPRPERAEAAREVIGPTSEMQYRLAHIWEDLLHVHPISIRDNFFLMGGHSLLAVRMLSMVEQICGQRLPMSTLFEEATIEHLADVLERGVHDVATRTHIIPVQRGGPQTPFFFLHGDWQGGAFYCLKMAHALGPEQPFYALDPYRFNDMRLPPTIEEIATAHIAAMREIQPEGPYILGGFCNGAIFACEIARQLRVAGEEVPLLVLINTDTLHPHPRLYALTRGMGAVLHLNEEQQFEMFLLCEWGWRLLRRIRRKGRRLWRRLLAKPQATATKPPDQGIPIDGHQPLLPSRRVRHMRWSDIYNWVIESYTPHPYDGAAVLLWTRDDLENKEPWAALMNPESTEHIIVPGSHITCRTKFLDALAGQLRASLDRARPPSPIRQ